MIETVIQRIENYPRDKRLIIALAGAPASGKSTLAQQLCAHFGQAAVVLPMDGFHLDDEILERKNLLQRKGAPETFDADGFLTIIKRVANGDHVYAPVFDRDREISRAGAIEIARQSIIIVEGNYLLLDKTPWNRLASYWDLAFFIDVPLNVIEERCVKRWLDQGLSEIAAINRAQNNDLVNAKLVVNGLFSHKQACFEILRSKIKTGH